ncbi:MAG: response regulator [Bacteroidota bacterium]
MMNLQFNYPLVYLVDDNSMDNDLSQLAIQAIDPNIQTTSFLDGREVLSHISKLPNEGKSPSLMVLDVNMPFVGGFEVLAELQHSPYKTFPIIIMSSSSLPDDQERAKQLGAAGIYEKPYGYLETVDLYREIFMKHLVPEVSSS